MPRRTILSTAQRASFEILSTEPSELAKHYTLSPEDLVLIRKRRRSMNRLGFAVQLCLIRYPGRTLRSRENPPQLFIEFIAEQIGCEACNFSEYASRDQTRREHVAFLIAEFKLSTFTDAHFLEISQWLVPVAFENPKSIFLVEAVLNELRHRRILHPPMTHIERIISKAETEADRRVFREINDSLSDEHFKALDKWLIPEDGIWHSRMSWARQPVGRPCPANVLAILERITEINLLDLPEKKLHDLPKYRQYQLSREGRKMSVQNLRELLDERRYSVITIALLDIRCSLIDEAISMHDQIVGRLIRRSQQKHADQFQGDAKRIKRVINTFTILTKALTFAKESGENSLEIIEKNISWEDLKAISEDAEDLIQPKRLNHLHFVQAHYPQIRRYAPALIEEFDFQAATAGRDVIAAINILRELNATGKRKLPENVPVSFVTSMWKSLVHQNEGVDRRYYELCVLSELRNRLRSGDIWISGSKQYREFDSHLLGKTAFDEMRTNSEVPVAVESDCDKYIAERTNLLQMRLDEVHQLAKYGNLDDVEIKDNRFSIKPYRGIELSKEIKEFTQKVYAELPRIKITDLLVEVDNWTAFTEQFSHLRTGLPPKNKQGMLTVILSEGINLGLTRMADASPGNSFRELTWIEDWHIRDECYSRALAELVNHHHSMELVDQLGRRYHFLIRWTTVCLGKRCQRTRPYQSQIWKQTWRYFLHTYLRPVHTISCKANKYEHSRCYICPGRFALSRKRSEDQRTLYRHGRFHGSCFWIMSSPWFSICATHTRYR